MRVARTARRRARAAAAGASSVADHEIELGCDFYTPVDDLVPVLDSYWLVIHVAAAIISGGVFTIGAITAALGILKAKKGVQLKT